MPNQPEFMWGVEDQEILCETLNDAVVNAIEDGAKSEIEVFKFQRRSISIEEIADSTLERTLERYDADFGDQVESTEATESMRSAAEAFAIIFQREYFVFQCERVPGEPSITISVEEWETEGNS